MSKNLSAARSILNGETTVSRDRRKGDAPKVEFTSKTVGKMVMVRTAYGVSYGMHEALEALAKKVECVDGRFVYYFAA